MFPDTLVVPLDGSEFAARALPVASAFVRQTGGRLLLMTTRWDDDMRSASAYLDEIAAAHQDVDVSTIVIGDRTAASAIQLVARESPGRIVCMTTHGRGRLRWAMLVCVDGTTSAPSVEPTAVEWAKSLGLDVRVATVVHPLDAVGPDAELVAMSSHARVGSARFALGSVTIGVVGIAHGPVLVNRTA